MVGRLGREAGGVEGAEEMGWDVVRGGVDGCGGGEVGGGVDGERELPGCGVARRHAGERVRREHGVSLVYEVDGLSASSGI